MKKIFPILLFGFILQNVSSQQSYPGCIIEKEITDWEFRMEGETIWKSARVPGTVIGSLFDLSDISNPLHPYYGDNEKLYQWVGEKDWEFRTFLELDSSSIQKGSQFFIEFESLDLYADIYLNGKLTGSSNNAFVPWRSRLLTYDNISDNYYQSNRIEVLIHFHSTNDSTSTLTKFDNQKLPGGQRVYARTAQYQFGWDWGPSFINMGIRKPVKIIVEPSKTASINFFHFESQNIGEKKSTIKFEIDYYTDFDSLDCSLQIALNGNIIFSERFSDFLRGRGFQSKYLHFLENAELWWPNGTGLPQNYYTYTVRFYLPGETLAIAEKSENYAVSIIRLKQEKDKHGESFYFTVNGKRIYAKGANYIPDDSFDPGKNSEDLITMAANANINMLRIWGGGAYPNNRFYDLCMQHGIMIWQDYMFACAMYPGNEDYLKSVTHESDYQTQRLENFNNIALWCGNNENDEGWKNWGWQKEFKYTTLDSTIVWNNYLKLFDTILKKPDHNTHNNRQYIPSSPKFGWGREQSMTHGDSHYWGVWWGLEPIEKFNNKVPRFMSEFGMQAMPDLRTLKKVIPDTALSFMSPKFKNHQKHPNGFETLNHYLKEYFVVPLNMEDYTYATQILQAYTLTTAIEAQRRAMPYCMGSLIWQLNDCWPGTSWSLIDYKLIPKIGFESVTEAYQPIIISVKETITGYDVYLVNDQLKGCQINLLAQINDFSGKTIFTKKAFVKIKQGESKIGLTINKSQLKNIDLTTVYLTCSAYQAGNMQLHLLYDKDYYHFVKPNELKLIQPEFTFSRKHDGLIELEVSTYCPYVFIPGNDIYNNIYLGHLVAGTYPCYFLNNFDSDQLNYLQNISPQIKCLNRLLK